MSTRRLAAIAFLAALGLAPPATAKELEQVKACGADGCRTTKSVGPDAYGLLPPAGTPRLVPFYRLHIGFGDGTGKVLHRVAVLWAPRIGMIAGDEMQPHWMTAAEPTRRLAERLTRGLKPFPAADMPVALPAARVDEVVTPAAAAATGGGPPWALLALACAGAAGAALLVRPARRRAASRAARRAFRRPSRARG